MKLIGSFSIFIGFWMVIVGASELVGKGRDFEATLKELVGNGADVTPPPDTSSDDITILGPQVLKMVSLIDDQANKAKDYLEENEKNGRKGFLYILGDLYKQITNRRKLFVGAGKLDLKDDFIKKSMNMIEYTFAQANNKQRHMRELSGLVEPAEALQVVSLDAKDAQEQRKANEDYIKSIEIERAKSQKISEDEDQNSDSERRSPDELVIDETGDFLGLVTLLSGDLPTSLTNSQIRSFATDVLTELGNDLDTIDANVPKELSANFSDFIVRLKNLLSVADKISIDELKQLFYAVHNKLNGLITSLLTNGETEKARKQLQKLSMQLWDLQELLNRKLPYYAPLKAEFSSLIAVLRQKISESDQLAAIDDQQKIALALLVKNHMSQEFNDVDYNVLSVKLKDMSRDLREAILKRLEASFSEANIQEVIHELIEATKKDMEHLKDPSSASGYVIDSEKMGKIERIFLERFKAIFLNGERVIIKVPVQSLDQLIKKFTKSIDDAYKPDSVGQPRDALTLFNGLLSAETMVEEYQKAAFSAITSQEFEDELSKYFKRYIALIVDLEGKLGIERPIRESELLREIKKDIGVTGEEHSWMAHAFLGAQTRNLPMLSATDLQACHKILQTISRWSENKERLSNEKFIPERSLLIRRRHEIVNDIQKIHRELYDESESLVRKIKDSSLNGIDKVNGVVTDVISGTKEAGYAVIDEVLNTLLGKEQEGVDILKSLIEVAGREGEIMEMGTGEDL